MASIEELKAERLSKIDGMDAYPSESKYTKTIKEFLSEFVSTPSPSERGQGVRPESLVGRVMTKRSFGNLAFAKIFDGTGEVQVVLEREISENSINYFENHIDTGDFVQATGINYVTKKGENSLLVSEIKIISKALLPLPDKYSGLEDVEEKMRKRYLDLLLDSEKRDLFYKKAKFWQVVRNYLNEKNFLEVETPTLELTTGGAEARPFKTHHNDYDIDVYLRISVGELWQKRLMAAGFTRTYEIGRAYRNEGSSPNHLQEFTNCEFYMAYANYNDGMEIVKELYRKIAREVFGKTEFTHASLTFDLAKDWDLIDYAERIKNDTGIDVWSSSDEDIKNKLKELGVKYEGENRERLLDTLWKYCRKAIAGPAFLINHPSLTSPLAKRRVDNKDTVEKFQIILAGSEVGNGYSELNDPRLQRANFDQQQKMLDGGDEEAMMPDFDFVEMLEHGMPPTCGFGFGDRLFAFLAGLPIRETVMFPLVKPIEDNTIKKEARIVTAILNSNSNLERWQELNTIAHLACEFAGQTKHELFSANEMMTKDKNKINLNIKYPINIKNGTKDQISLFYRKCKDNNISLYSFTREMLDTTNDNKIIKITSEKMLSEIEFLGVLIFGEKDLIDVLTKEFSLYV